MIVWVDWEQGVWFGLDLRGGREVVVLVDSSAVWMAEKAFGEVVE